jgi:hypothetical protein
MTVGGCWPWPIHGGAQKKFRLQISMLIVKIKYSVVHLEPTSSYPSLAHSRAEEIFRDWMASRDRASSVGRLLQPDDKPGSGQSTVTIL